MLCKVRLLLCFFILLSTGTFLYGQETPRPVVPVTLKQADSIFLAKNLLLLAARYNVEASRAQVIQARLFNNITFSLSQNVYNPESKEWFDLTETGETAMSFEKLFLLAGKRNKRINFADLSWHREEQHYFDLIRTLKYTLRSDFNNIYYLKRILAVYDREINSLAAMVAVFQQQSQNGLVSAREYLRLRSSLFSLESEKSGYVTQLIADLADFNLLMHTAGIDYEPLPDTLAAKGIQLESVRVGSLMDTAARYRSDLLMAGSDLELSQVNLKMQKAQAVPDLTLSAGWDRNGSFVHNYNFIGMQIDLPFFNRNQGNIRSAELGVENSRVMLQSAGEKVRSDVMQAYATALEADRLYRRYDEKFVGALEAMNNEMKKNYENRNISTVEFLDFYDAYKNNFIQLNNLQNARANAIENLSFCIGRDFAGK